MTESRAPSAWAYVLTFALVASSVTTLAVMVVMVLSALIPTGDYDAGLYVLLASPMVLVLSWAYGLIPAGLTGVAAWFARRGGTRFRFRLICVLAGGATSALFCLPWGISVESALIAAGYGGAGALAAAMLTRRLMRLVLASA